MSNQLSHVCVSRTARNINCRLKVKKINQNRNNRSRCVAEWKCWVHKRAFLPVCPLVISALHTTARRYHFTLKVANFICTFSALCSNVSDIKRARMCLNVSEVDKKTAGNEREKLCKWRKKSESGIQIFSIMLNLLVFSSILCFSWEQVEFQDFRTSSFFSCYRLWDVALFSSAFQRLCHSPSRESSFNCTSHSVNMCFDFIYTFICRFVDCWIK